MGEVLSQSEIDELFKALNTGEIDVNDMQEANEQKGVKVYDFTRPSKFSKEQLRTLEIIFENGTKKDALAVPILEVNLKPLRVLKVKKLLVKQKMKNLI